MVQDSDQNKLKVLSPANFARIRQMVKLVAPAHPEFTAEFALLEKVLDGSEQAVLVMKKNLKGVWTFLRKAWGLEPKTEASKKAHKEGGPADPATPPPPAAEPNLQENESKQAEALLCPEDLQSLLTSEERAALDQASKQYQKLAERHGNHLDRKSLLGRLMRSERAQHRRLCARFRRKHQTFLTQEPEEETPPTDEDLACQNPKVSTFCSAVFNQTQEELCVDVDQEKFHEEIHGEPGSGTDYHSSRDLTTRFDLSLNVREITLANETLTDPTTGKGKRADLGHIGPTHSRYTPGGRFEP